MLYFIGFTAVLFSLIGIFKVTPKLNDLSWLILPGLTLWGLGLMTASPSFSAMFACAFLDLLTWGIAALGLSLMANNAHLPWGLSIVVVMMLGGLRLSITTDQHANTVPISTNLDESGELLVELKNNVNLEEWETFLTLHQLEARQAFEPADGNSTDLDDYYVINLPPQANLEEWENILMSSGLIDWVEPNEIISLEVNPARLIPGINKRLGVDDPGVKNQWAMDALKMDKLYNYLSSNEIGPKKKALVAILDTGVDAKHEDLQDNFRSINKKYNDDPKGHGTHCAGIAGAVTNNGVGVASIARTDDFFEITSIKVLGAAGSGSQEMIIDGIIEAADNGADVISLSLGGFSTQSRQRAYSQAVKYAAQKGAIVVASAGNSNREASGFSPVNATGVIGVSAIDNQLQRADFSNRVSKLEMGIAAPGVGIYSTKPNNTYDSHNGTSMACPHVSGLIGLMKSIRPELTTKEAFKILHETGIKTRDTKNTGMLIQPYPAVQRVVEMSI